MNREELKKTLEKEHIRPDVYDLNGGHIDETLTLGEANGRWFVYYSERGLESDRREFDTETEACEYLLSKLRSDPTARSVNDRQAR